MARIKQTRIEHRLEDYIFANGMREHPAQKALRAATGKMPNGGMQIGAPQGALMALLAQAIGAKRCIEIGVFTGYSALSVALALPPEGRIVACDVSEDYTAVGRKFWERAGVAGKIDLRIGPAVDTVTALLAAGEAGRFDFAFIDADKTNYDAYYEGCLKLVRRGGLLVLDNMLWSGDVADPEIHDADTDALRALNLKIQQDERVDFCLLSADDGILLARRR